MEATMQVAGPIARTAAPNATGDRLDQDERLKRIFRRALQQYITARDVVWNCFSTISYEQCKKKKQRNDHLIQEVVAKANEMRNYGFDIVQRGVDVNWRNSTARTAGVNPLQFWY